MHVAQRSVGSRLRWMTLLAVAATAGGCRANATFVGPPSAACDEGAAAPETIRVATYNVRAGLETSLEEVGNTIEAIGADVIALQEVDRGVDRSNQVDQARVLAERLGYNYVYAAAIDRGGGSYGIALLSRLPIASAERVPLRGGMAYEPRVAIDARLCVGARPIRMVATHADFLPWSAVENARDLAERLRGDLGQGLIVAGDLNQTPREEGPRRFSRLGLKDVLGERAEGVSFWPGQTRVDYLFADATLGKRVRAAAIGNVKASDHYPAWMDIEVKDL